MKSRAAVAVSLFALALAACAPAGETVTESLPPQPKEIIDLGALVTEDLTERVWGKRYPKERGWDRPNVFEVIRWQRGQIRGANSFYTLFNHGGPHVDAPNHMGFENGIDAYSLDQFAGPLKVYDFSHLANGRTVKVEIFEGQDIRPGDIVLIYTGYTPPETDEDYPETITLTGRAAEYLANIPVRAYGTDAWSVGTGPGQRAVKTETDVAKLIPAHHAFLSRGIPIYEQLFSVDKLLGKENMFFVGVPLNIKDGDGMIVRPVVFVY